MLQIGITIEEVGIIYAVLPFASCLGPPIAGKKQHSLSIFLFKPYLFTGTIILLNVIHRNSAIYKVYHLNNIFTQILYIKASRHS